MPLNLFSVKEERKKKEAEASRLAAEAGQAREQLLVVGVCHSNSYGSCCNGSCQSVVVMQNT